MSRAKNLRSCAVLLFLCLAGCGDDPAPLVPQEQPEPTTRFWSGDFGDATDGGPLVLELVQTGEAVRGEMAFWSPRTASRYRGAEHLYVRGNILDGVMQLELDTDRVPYQFTFTLDGTLGPESQLEGELTLRDFIAGAPVSCRPLEKRTLQVADSHVVPYGISAIAFDGNDLWLSTLEHEYVRTTTDLEVVGTVGVRYEGIGYWTSSSLSFDGQLLWGFLPTTVVGPGWSRNESKIIGFNSSGRIVSMFYLSHRTNGLAYDGTDYWSLDSEGPRVHRYDTVGAVLESLDIDVPDATSLEADATSFWTMGWYLQRLYRLDRAGRITAVYDLPAQDFGYSTGLALEGTAVWHARSDPFGGDARLYRLLPE